MTPLNTKTGPKERNGCSMTGSVRGYEMRRIGDDEYE
jgi:hypothetical protein